MTDNNRKKELIEKIKKLLSLSENNPNEHEAAAAAEKARELLEAYEIAEHELSEKPEEVTEAIHNTHKSKIPQWLLRLANTTAKHFNCEIIFHYKRYERSAFIKFLGTPTDIEIATYTFTYLKRTIEEMSKNILPDNGASTRRFRESYRSGIVQGISNNLFVLRKKHNDTLKPEMQTRSGDLILVKKDAIQNYKRIRYPNLKTKTNSYNPEYDAFNRGREHGKGISINSAINRHNNVRSIQ